MSSVERRPQQAFLQPVGTTGLRGYSLAAAAGGEAAVARLPYCLRVLAENVLRHIGTNGVTQDDFARLVNWSPAQAEAVEVPFHPARVLMQDYTGIPSLVDLAMLRDGMRDASGDPTRVNPRIPVDLVIDHSLIVDAAGSADAERINMAREFERNAERFALAKWAQQAFPNLRVVPPGRGILHQVNVEHIAQVVRAEDGIAFPDTMVGTDSHSTMVNGLGVLGWGVGGIEAEAAMMGLPLVTAVKRVVGVKLTGALREGVTATDLVLTLTQLLRKAGVVDALVEFFGPALDTLGVADRATLANMAPEYGSNCALYPVDALTIEYLRLTGREAQRVEAYARFQGLWRDASTPEPLYTDVVQLHLAEVVPSVAGPRKPHELRALDTVAALHASGAGAAAGAARVPGAFDATRRVDAVSDGAVVIAAITSCTNTSNPSVMLAAGLLARNAVARGLRTRPWVKTSLTPGSRAVGEYLRAAGLQDALDALGFNIAGYGCATCGGNSGELAHDVEAAIRAQDLAVCSVLSGNRNFEARVHQLVKGNYLMSPPLVVAYALAGHMGVDLTREPLGTDRDGKPVMLRELWPSDDEVQQAVQRFVGREVFERGYRNLFEGAESWQQLRVAGSELFPWDARSTYIRKPPYLDADLAKGSGPIEGARALLVLGDGITTDHISPAAAIAPQSPAAQYLRSHGVKDEDFNAYGSRRSNHEVMVRGAFANIRLRNELVDREGGCTRIAGTSEVTTVYEAAERYREQGTPLVIVAGKDYGAGSSRDWAAKGTRLLGVKAVIAEGFERIHRSNLANMGVLPLQFMGGQTRKTLGLDGSEQYFIDTALAAPGATMQVTIRRSSGTTITIDCRCRLDTASEVEVWRAGGMMPFVHNRLSVIPAQAGIQSVQRLGSPPPRG
ncbi:aconitate hydratase AcnA [Ramlibacter albus]|uniref:Aconitate hydratase n=1 Tax=Ramlibacter albus TaxID=2079448 RepID=A0A923M5X6_9BURK|nr:aconitate hydratase AcnA [Ramlibacter albus]MBC5764550.1 aconitate hydratase AcnA [Ramlibacter albus]